MAFFIKPLFRRKGSEWREVAHPVRFEYGIVLAVDIKLVIDVLAMFFDGCERNVELRGNLLLSVVKTDKL